ncbi:class I SAM-dependent methyltransferase [Salinilacihabitans rarus]|uniref:class I SAM-dependent methyltransferase n=1 Tax=Salinilacihabitans rarus TaxID=2961596 RepID=UPI0020C83417|nr:class I SAM-dependent methyltransferase [Salinilacihabitans rarus]
MAPSDDSAAAAADPVSHPAFAALYDRCMPDRFLVAPHREYLAADLSGRVLDLGAGDGATFPYVAEASDAATIEYHAVEPDPNMRRRAAETARETDLDVHLRDARGESLPYADDAFDAVLSGLVFCTIADPDAALDEVARVLQPDGEFRFLEHVRADGWRASGQELLNPVWKRAAGGCNLTRETVARFVGHDAFAVEEVERVALGIFPASPMHRGRLRRTRDAVGSR